jgi:hypothetical protein
MVADHFQRELEGRNQPRDNDDDTSEPNWG